MFPSWWRSLTKLANQNGKAKRRGRKQRGRPRPTCRPTVEQFEDRLVPTTLSLGFPNGANGVRGGDVLTAINNGPLSSGLSGGDFVLYYDSSLFTVSSPSIVTASTPPSTPTSDNVHLGSLLNSLPGWQLSVNALVPGQLIMSLSGSTPISGAVSGGQVVTVDFQVKNTGLPSIPWASPIDLAADADFSGNPLSETDLTDSTGNLYTLSPAPQDNSTAIQTITFGGTINASSNFELAFNGATTAPINYSATASTLQANIQSALNTTFGSGNMLVAVNSPLAPSNPNVFTVTFEGALGGIAGVPPLTPTNVSFTGTNPSISVANSGPPNGHPAVGYFGSDPNDGTITITDSNTAPVAVADSYTSSAGDVLAVPGPGSPNNLLANDTFYQGDGVQTEIASNPSHGTIVLNGNQLITFTGTPVTGDTFQLLFDNFTTAPITYNANPATLQNNIQTALSNLVNNTPISGLGTPVVNASSATSVNVRFSFASPTNVTEPAITVFASNFANSGTAASVVSQGSFVYTPNTAAAFTGSDSFSYTVFDPVTGATSIAATVTINLTARLSLPANLVTNQGTTITVPVNIDNPNPPNSGGLTGVALAIEFDATKLNVAPSDVHLSSLTSSWNLATPVVTTGGVGTYSGELDIALSSPTPITTSLGGALVFITFHVNSGLGSTPLSTDILVAQTNTVNPNPVATKLSAVNANSLPIVPAPQNNVFVSGLDSMVEVLPQGYATHFQIVAPASVIAASGFHFTVTGLDSSNNLATSYTGTMNFTTSDTAVTPGGPDLQATGTLVNGVGVFSATLLTAGSQTLVATDSVISAITGSSNPILVNPKPASFLVSAPTSATAGTPISFTVTAETSNGQTSTSYSGTVVFSSSDAAAVFLPTSATLVSGVGVFNVTLKTAGFQTLTATDSTTPAIVGFSNPIQVIGGPASEFIVTGPTTPVSAGTGFSFTVTADDSFGNLAAGYSGTVAFTTSDHNTVVTPKLPFPRTLTNGVGVFSATLYTSGSQTITATDTVTSSITGASNPINIIADAANHFSVAAPSSSVAGSPFPVTVTALDQFNNQDTTFSANIDFTSSDKNPNAFLPTNSPLTGGQGTFAVSLVTAGLQTLTATDHTAPGITGTSGPINVNAGAATQFVFSTPVASSQGAGFAFTVTAEDQFNNVSTGYTGTVGFRSSDTSPQVKLPGNSTLTNGSGVFSATLFTLGNQNITATDTFTGSITGTSAPIVIFAQAAGFVVTAPPNATAGTGFLFTVTAVTANNTVATTYTGVVTFSTTDPGLATQLPGGAQPLTSGVGTFSATLTTAGMWVIKAVDQNTSGVTGTISGTSGPITVSASSATHYLVTAPLAATAGTPITFTVTAEDRFNNTATSYTGHAGFSSSDKGAASQLPAPSTLNNGVGTFSATLTTSGTQSITAADTLSPGINGVSNPIVVSAGVATHFIVAAPGTLTAGIGGSFTVTAEDQFNNTATGYGGTVLFSTSDPQVPTLPSNKLINGVGTFSVTLKTAGTQTLTATDSANHNITGVSNPITVNAGAATHLVIGAPAGATAGNGFAFTVTAEDQFNNTATGYGGIVHFTSSDLKPTTSLPANSTLNNGVGTFSATLTTSGSQILTAADTVATSITAGTTTVLVSTAAANHYAITVAVSTVPAGTPFLFTVTAQDAFNNAVTGYAGTVHFTSTDAQASTPADSTLNNGVGTFAATLRTAGKQTLFATDKTTSSINGASGPITVTPLSATHLAIISQATVTAGVGFGFTVAAEDKFNNVATSYNGTVQFNTSDTSSLKSLPGPSALTNGVGVFNATLITQGFQTLGANDIVTTTIAGSSFIQVVAANVNSLSIAAPTSATAGTAFSFTVMALDQFNNVATTYSGLVKFTSSDPSSNVSLPANSTLVAGVGVFNATLATTGFQTLVATDTSVPSLTASSNPILVSAAAASHFAVSAPTSTVAGTGFNFTVTAEDLFNNVVKNYAGSVHFTSSDPSATLPLDSTLTNGTGTFNAILGTVGSQSLTASDSQNSGVIGSSQINVVAGVATHFFVGAPAAANAGVPFTYTVIAEDKFNNRAVSYAGTVQFSSSDHNVPFTTLPANSTLVSGQGSFTATLTTAGTQTLVATDVTTSISGSATIAVSSALTPTHFSVFAPGTATAGNAFVIIVQALDQFNNQVNFNSPFQGYNGTVQFSTSDEAGSFYDGNSLTTGWGVFGIILKTQGNQTITVSDPNSPSIASGKATIAVSPSFATHFAVTLGPLTTSNPASVPGVLPSTGVAITGTSYPGSVTALDAYGNVANGPANGYNGTVALTSSDPAVPSLGTINLTSGVGSFNATLQTTGSRFILATGKGTQSGTISSSSASIPVRDFVVTSLIPTSTGFTAIFSKPFNTPTGPNALNIYDASTANYGPADITLSGPLGSVRGSAVFGNFDLITNQPTSITFVKTSTYNLSVFNPSSGLLAAGHYSTTLRSALNGFTEFADGSLLDGNDSGTPGTNFTAPFAISSPLPVAVGVPYVARGPSLAFAITFPSSFTNSSTFTLTYNGTQATGLITYSTTASTLQANIQNALNSLPAGPATAPQDPPGSVNFAVVVPNNATNGAIVTYQYDLATSPNPLTGTGVSVTASNVNLTTNTGNGVQTDGIPLNLSNANGATSGSFSLQYNTVLLRIGGFTLNPNLPAGVTSSFSRTVSGSLATVTVSFTSTGSISSTNSPLNLGSLQASVPLSATASYANKELLHFSSEQLNGVSGPIPITNDDAIQVVAYLGDASGNGSYDPLDPALISRVTTALDSGFAAYPMLDPIIIADISVTGSFTGTDASLLNKYLSGSPVSQIPSYPVSFSAPLTFAATGPDPALSVGDGSQAAPGGTVTVPVNIDTAKPVGSTGMIDAVLALQYDPQVFTVGVDDIQLGSLPSAGSGWHLISAVNEQTGQIGVELYSLTPIQTTAGGSLVTISLHVRDQAPAGVSDVSLVSHVSAAGQVYQTEVADGQGTFVLHPAATATGIEPGLPGELTVLNPSPASIPASLNFSVSLPDVAPVVASTSEAQPALANVASAASAVQLAVIEQLFGNPEQTALVMHDGTFSQPGPLLSGDSGDRTVTGGIRDLALVQGPALAGSRDWVSDDVLAYLGQTMPQGMVAAVPALLDGSALGLDDSDGVVGLDAFFALQASGGGRFKVQ
jgi:hypothetical protein